MIKPIKKNTAQIAVNTEIVVTKVKLTFHFL